MRCRLNLNLTKGEELQAKIQLNDGGDESINLYRSFGLPVLACIGTKNKLPSATPLVALKDGGEARKFTFSQT